MEELRIRLDIANDLYDVVHLSGHAGHEKDLGSVFYTEDELGGLHRATADEIFQNLNGKRRPTLLFFQGVVRGGAAEAGRLPSLSEALVKKGIPFVAGWAQPVYDFTATTGAAHLYKQLSRGESIPRAMREATVAMLQDAVKYPDWHLLRLYAATAKDESLIVPGRHIVPLRSHFDQFLMPIDK
ncbi:MAG: CHAT domain-containing protein [Saprospiraceae bacterium]